MGWGRRFYILKIVFAMFVVAKHSELSPRWLLPASSILCHCFDDL